MDLRAYLLIKFHHTTPELSGLALSRECPVTYGRKCPSQGVEHLPQNYRKTNAASQKFFIPMYHPHVSP